MFPACTTHALARCGHALGTDTWDMDTGSRRCVADVPPGMTELYHVVGRMAEDIFLHDTVFL